MVGGLRVGLLYPTPDAGEDDFLDLAGVLRPALDLEVVYFPWPEDVDDLAAMDTGQVVDALRRLGSARHLERVLPATVGGRGLDAVAFAVSSASFLDGSGGVERQVRTIERVVGCAATSTTLAFQQAIRHLGLSRVSLASVYHPEVSEHFIARVRDVGADVVNRVDASARSDRELAAWTQEQIVDLVKRAAHADAQAVLLPETALHTSHLIAELERAAGCPVLTATQVTLWAATRLIGTPTVGTEAGPLFVSTPDRSRNG